MNRSQLSITALLLGSATLVQAAEETMAPIVVTATRTAQSVDETLASVTVITREDIERSQSQSVMELLQGRSTGLDVSRNGGPGSNTSLFLRGSESDHVLVLVDGVRVASVTSGTYNWASLDPSQIERIEIVRGPHSTLYGSEAIGGVIQIFTRKGEGVHASLGAGSYNTATAAVGSAGRLGQGRYHLNISHQQSDGFSTTSPDSSRYEADEDEYSSSSIGAGFSSPLGKDAEIALNLLHNEGSNDYDDSGYTDAHANTENSSVDLHVDWQTSDSWNQRLTLSGSQDHNESFDSWPADITTRRTGLSWQNDLIVGDESLLTLGIDAQEDTGEIAGSYDEKTTNRAGYIQYQWSGQQYDLLLGARSDDHSKYDRHTTGRLVVGSRLGLGRVYASYATAFKAPTFNELYYPFYGDPTIKPEESTSTELGYRLGNLQATLFQTRVENMIQSDPVTWMAVNTGKARIEGLELEYGYQLDEWRLDGGLTLQKAEDEESGDKLLRRAEKKLFLTANGPITAEADLGIELNYTGERMDYGNVELDAYTLLNLNGSFRIDKQWKLTARIENLLDEEYELVSGYNTPGLSAYANLHYKM